MTKYLVVLNMDLLSKAKGIKRKSIWAFFLTFTIIGIIATMILTMIAAIQILTTDWKNESLNSQKTMWGLLCFFLLGPISGWVFGGKAIAELENGAK